MIFIVAYIHTQHHSINAVNVRNFQTTDVFLSTAAMLLQCCHAWLGAVTVTVLATQRGFDILAFSWTTVNMAVLYSVLYRIISHHEILFSIVSYHIACLKGLIMPTLVNYY